MRCGLERNHTGTFLNARSEFLLRAIDWSEKT